MKFRILWPDKRTVDERTIQGWARDAMANDEIEEVDADDPRACADALNGAGLITLAAKSARK